jgi:hypothetical protein
MRYNEHKSTDLSTGKRKIVLSVVDGVSKILEPDVVTYLWQHPVFEIRLWTRRLLVHFGVRIFEVSRFYGTWSPANGWLMLEVSRQRGGLVWTSNPWRWEPDDLETPSNQSPSAAVTCRRRTKGSTVPLCQSVKFREGLARFNRHYKKEVITLATNLLQKLKKKKIWAN